MITAIPAGVDIAKAECANEVLRIEPAARNRELAPESLVVRSDKGGTLM